VSRDGLEARHPRLTSTLSLHPVSSGVFDVPSDTRLVRAPSRQARTHRRRFRTSELPEPRRLPSVRPRPCGRSGPARAHCYTCADQSSTLVACRDPFQPRQRRGGRFKLPRSPRPAFRRTARTRKRCSYPISATDLRHEHPTEQSIPETRRPSLADPRGPSLSRQCNPGGASLDGDPPASATIAHCFTTRFGPRPQPTCDQGIARSWRALRSTGPPAMPPWPRRFRPLTGLAM